MIISSNNDQLTIYSTKVDKEQLVSLQENLIEEYGSKEIVQKQNILGEQIRLLTTKKKGEKNNIIQKKEVGSIEVWNGSHSHFEDSYNVTYEHIQLPLLGQIIEEIMNGDLTALISLLSPAIIEQPELFIYAKRIASCIEFIPCYSSELKPYLEVQAIFEQFHDEQMKVSLNYFSELTAIGNQMIEIVQNLKIPQTQKKLK